MNKRLYCACAAMALAAAPCFAGGQSWNGTWKLNEAKSKTTGFTFTIDDKGNGMMHESDGATEYDFACDGKPYSTMMGHTTTCTGSAAAGYDSVGKVGDKVIYKSHRSFSPDGKTMTIHGTEMRPDGTTQEYTDVFQRESGTSGLVGKWRNVKAENGPGSMVIEMKGDWIKMTVPQYKATTEGKMDGSDLPLTGPTIAPGNSTAIKLAGPNKLQYTDKYQGKVLDEGTMTLSADGKTVMGEEWIPGKMNEKSTYVWERQ